MSFARYFGYTNIQNYNEHGPNAPLKNHSPMGGFTAMLFVRECVGSSSVAATPQVYKAVTPRPLIIVVVDIAACTPTS